MNNHLKGLLLTTLGVLLVVPDSLFVRLIEEPPLVTAFWRSLTAGLFVLVLVLPTEGVQGFKNITKTGWAGVIYICLMGSTAPGFVLAVENTSVANVVFIFATIPVFAALFSWVFLGEVIGRRMVLTMLVVIAGLGVIAYGSTSNAIAHWSGDLMALGVAAAFAAALTAVRKVKDISLVPAVAVAYLLSALGLLLVTDPLGVFAEKWLLFTLHGAFIAAATCLMTMGPRYLPSAEVSLLLLLESVLAPILVWFVIGEDPGALTLVGGVIVIVALVVSNLVVLRRAKS